MNRRMSLVDDPPVEDDIRRDWRIKADGEADTFNLFFDIHDLILGRRNRCDVDKRAAGELGIGYGDGCASCG